MGACVFLVLLENAPPVGGLTCRQLSPHTNSGDPAHELGRPGWPDASNSRGSSGDRESTGKSNSKWPAVETGGEVARGGEVAAVETGGEVARGGEVAAGEKLEKLEKLPAVMVQAERETC